MNEAQKLYANSDMLIGNLLTQIDTFYQSLPDAVKESYDRIGEKQVVYACHVDGEIYNDCVLDTMRIQDCCCAQKLFRDGKTKPTDCEHWKPIAFVINR